MIFDHGKRPPKRPQATRTNEVLKRQLIRRQRLLSERVLSLDVCRCEPITLSADVPYFLKKQAD